MRPRASGRSSPRGYPAYTTSAGWLGYGDDKVESLVREALAAGFTHVKMKVGADLEADDAARGSSAPRSGRDGTLMMDANQVWGVDEAIAAMRRWRARAVVDRGADEPRRRARARAHPPRDRADPRRHGRARPEPRDLQAAAQAEAIDVCQIDTCRLGGVNEVIAVLLLAARFGMPVCPHAGGVGLCEYVQHLAFFDYIAVSGSLENRVVEWVDHLHEHFRDPAVVAGGRYVAPALPGYSIEMLPSSLDEFEFPAGPAWS